MSQCVCVTFFDIPGITKLPGNSSCIVLLADESTPVSASEKKTRALFPNPPAQINCVQLCARSKQLRNLKKTVYNQTDPHRALLVGNNNESVLEAEIFVIRTALSLPDARCRFPTEDQRCELQCEHTSPRSTSSDSRKEATTSWVFTQSKISVWASFCSWLFYWWVFLGALIGYE